MLNNYEVAEIVEVGRAQDVILGSAKLFPLVFESVDQPFWNPEMGDDE